MKKHLVSLVISALALSSAAFAATPSDTIDAGDIILGFYTAAGTGAGRNVTVNLGAYQQFDNQDGASFSVSALNVADLAAVYGASWNTRTDLVWAVTGATYTASVDGLTRNSVFVSSTRINVGDSPVSIAANNDTTQAGDRNKIQTIGTSFNVATTTANSTVTVNMDASNSQSMFALQAANNTVRFGASTANNNDANGTNISDFYGLVPTSGGANVSGNALASGWARGTNYLGSFSLDATGLTFTADGTAIPEPSTFAAIGGLVALGFVVSRRRRAA